MNYYFITNQFNPGAKVTYNGTTQTISKDLPYLAFIVTSKDLVVINPQDEQTVISGDVSFDDSIVNLYRVSFDNYTKFLPSQAIFSIDPNTYLPITPSAVTSIALLPFKDWYSSNKTDSRIVKILALPYAPFDLTFSSGAYDIPTG